MTFNGMQQMGRQLSARRLKASSGRNRSSGGDGLDETQHSNASDMLERTITSHNHPPPPHRPAQKDCSHNMRRNRCHISSSTSSLPGMDGTEHSLSSSASSSSACEPAVVLPPSLSSRMARLVLKDNDKVDEEEGEDDDCSLTFEGVVGHKEQDGQERRLWNGKSGILTSSQRLHGSWNDSQVSFSADLEKVIDIPHLSSPERKRCFYSDDEICEFRVEYEYELEGLLPSET